MTRQLPDGAVKHKETKRFTADTVPDALTRNHDTKPGVWALICVDTGTLTLSIGDPVSETLQLKAGESSVTHPQEIHRVSLQPGAVFHVEFYSLPTKDG